MSSARLGRPTTSAVERAKGSRRAGLGAFEVFTLAWRSIRANIMRSILTTLGIIIGVSSVVTLTSVGAGVQREITSSLTDLGTNLLTVTTSFGGGRGGLIRGPVGPTVTVSDAEAIRELNDPRIAGIAPVEQTNLQLKAGTSNINASIVGTWPDYESVRNAETEHGTFLSEADLAGRNRVIVLGFDVARELFPAGDAVGETVRVDGVSYQVLGVLADKGGSFDSPNRSAFVPLSTYLQRIRRLSPVGPPAVQSIFIKASSASVMSELQASIERLLAERHGTLTPEEYDFQVENQADILASLNEVTATLTLFLGAIAGISLLVGGIGIMNIMLVSVTERTREIGIRKALGARPRDILAQFLTESFVLSVGGGLLGIAIGLALSFGVLPQFGLSAVASPSSVGLAFAFSAAVGIFFGFYPARRAARLDPVDSLRYE